MSENQITAVPVDGVGTEAAVNAEGVTAGPIKCLTCNDTGKIIHGREVPCPDCYPEQAHLSGLDAWQYEE